MKSQSVPRILLIVFSLITIATPAFAQSGAAGGRLPSTPKPKATPEAADPNATKTTTNRSRQPAGLDRIDGKWLTTGNDFGTSELVLTQSGGNVTGIINFADGQTGSLTGTLVGKRLRHTFTTSAGESGSGWLELSWPQFLGGAYKSPRVRDGSWTLSRIEGNWCVNGDRTRVRRLTHDSQGRFAATTEDGGQETGYLNGYLFLNTPAGPVQGNTMYDRRYRVEWANGTVWTWCGR